MKSVSVDTNVVIPLDDIVDAIRPSVIEAVLNAKRSEQRMRRKDTATAVLDACRKISTALARYENSVGTRDEARALHQLVTAATGLRRVLKDNSNTL